MNSVQYPATWHSLESPSQRYGLLLALEEMLASSPDWKLAEVGDFLLDDISARDRPDGIVGGCLLTETEDRLFFVFLDGFESARSAGRVTDELRAAAGELLAQMRLAGVPDAAD